MTAFGNQYKEEEEEEEEGEGRVAELSFLG